MKVLKVGRSGLGAVAAFMRVDVPEPPQIKTILDVPEGSVAVIMDLDEAKRWRQVADHIMASWPGGGFVPPVDLSRTLAALNQLLP